MAKATSRLRLLLPRNYFLSVPLQHKILINHLRMAYSAEKAAAFAYQGHAGSVKNKDEKISIHQIEMDEWKHRREVLMMMKQYNIPVSKFYEIRFHII